MALPRRTHATLSLAVLCGALTLAPALPGQGPPAGPRGAGAAPGRPPIAVETFAIERRDLRETLRVVGSLAPNESAELRPELSGRVREILFAEGRPVRSGDVLVVLDDAELRAQLAQARAGYALAASNLERVRSLIESRTRSEADLDRARSEFDRAAAEVQLLEVRLDRTQLRAPFDGMVGSRSISVGDFVSPTTVITTVDDLSRLKVEFQVPEVHLARVAAGTQFTLSAAGTARTPVAGEVYFVSPLIDRRTRASEVKGWVVQPPDGLRPGMFATVELTLAVRNDVLTVPESAILAREGAQLLVVARSRDGSTVAEFVPVRLGLRERGLVEVAPLKGELEAGTPVVASGVGSLILLPGDRLNPRPLREALRPGPPAA